MDVRRITGRFGHRWLWCALGAPLALSPSTASAQNACGQLSPDDPQPGELCQNQTQAAVGYNALQTQEGAYYCYDPNGVYIYTWPGTYGIAFNNSCFTVAENPDPGDSGESDALYTNWCITGQSLTVVIAYWNSCASDCD